MEGAYFRMVCFVVFPLYYCICIFGVGGKVLFGSYYIIPLKRSCLARWQVSCLALAYVRSFMGYLRLIEPPLCIFLDIDFANLLTRFQTSYQLLCLFYGRFWE